MAEEASAFAADVAQSMGLACFDPQHLSVVCGPAPRTPTHHATVDHLRPGRAGVIGATARRRHRP
ncbi:hypothetical protein NCG97_02985 [Streptomyces lydicamycinicus]|uniref:hypothetical protein n=1 Tax=Streptomyces lydicamycinicus TaxID=1546107 RepID=UPI0020354ACB|nr:hypothetical protein [Streptomyces lydicamycinicus]URZ99875.1 hypothetical protein NCG97_02985 [Streptomyces lydicamycinicus]